MISDLDRRQVPPQTSPGYPIIRPRRLRRTPALRALVRETNLTPADVIYPLFVRPGHDLRIPISSMPGQSQWSVDRLVGEVRAVAALGIRAVMLFGIPEHKDAFGSENWDPDGIVPRAIRAIKESRPRDGRHLRHVLLRIHRPRPLRHHQSPRQRAFQRRPARTATCSTTRRSSCWPRASVAHAEAGADIIAPSGMIDGMVGAIRAALDSAGFEHVLIMSYAAKFASGFYGPFREAAESPPQFGDRSQYQMDPGNRREALKEAALDVAEGADMIMVKPALPYLDVLSDVRQAFNSRSPPTRSAASTPCSTPPPRMAGSTSSAAPWNP